MKETAVDMLLGIAIGDALGVPYEFLGREEMEKNPARDMVGFKTHNQPAGTWSDDSSLTFCLAEALVDGYSLKKVAANFIKWRNECYWAARNNVFDIGITTTRAISRLEKILINNTLDDLKFLKYEAEEYDNGNGSLMRILPLVYEIKGKSIKNQFDIVWENSALTHRHIRAAMSCMIYLKLAEYLIDGFEKVEAYQLVRTDIMHLWDEMSFSPLEKEHFARVIQDDIRNADKAKIKSGGYVIETLEATLWSFLNTDSYEDAVLTAINFGHDTDTTGAVTGGIAGLCYGMKEIPEYWIVSIARMEDIIELGEKLNTKYST